MNWDTQYNVNTYINIIHLPLILSMSLRVDASLLKDGDGQLGVGSNKSGLHSATTISGLTNVV